MCVILLALNQNEQFPFILAANRDEFYGRPTQAAHIWPNSPELIAGKDLLAGGTWLAVSRSGEFAAVTNHYGAPQKDNGRSRGELVTNFLLQSLSIEEYSASLISTKNLYNGYGLLYGNSQSVRYQSNQRDTYTELTEGIHGLGNHFLNSSWPRVEEGKRQMQRIVTDQDGFDPEYLFEILANGRDTDPSKRPQRPRAGNPSVIPSKLPLFVQLQDFGTRCSTVVTVNSFGEIKFEERTYDPMQNDYVQSKKFEFEIS